MDAIEYIREEGRLCREMRNAHQGCCPSDCPLYSLRFDEGKKLPCFLACRKNPEKAVPLVEEWSNEHPAKSLLQLFNEQHPKAPKNTQNLPTICPFQIGYEPKAKAPCFQNERYDCLSCWNRSAEGAEV